MVGRVTDGVESAHDGAHAGTHDDIHGDARFFQHLQHADVCHAFRSPTAQDDTHFFPLCLCGEGYE